MRSPLSSVVVWVLSHALFPANGNSISLENCGFSPLVVGVLYKLKFRSLRPSWLNIIVLSWKNLVLSRN